MRLNLLPIALLSAVAVLSACKPKEEAPVTPPAATVSAEDKALYALGVLASENLKSFDFTEKELERLQKGMSDSLLKKKLEIENPQEHLEKIRELNMARVAKAKEAAGVKNAAEGKAYLEKAEKEANVVKTDSGILYTEVKAGTGAVPKATDKIKMHYHGTLPDGKVFDSSVDRGQPLEYVLGELIPCWIEAVQRMKVGGKARLVCPSNLAYGPDGGGPIGPNTTLIFDVELLDILKK